MKQYFFWIQRDYHNQFEKIKVLAESDALAIKELPKCVSWDFSTR